MGAYSCQDVLAIREERAARVGVAVVAHDHLRAWVAGVAFVVEELRDVRNVLLTAAECMLGAHVVDADEQ